MPTTKVTCNCALCAGSGEHRDPRTVKKHIQKYGLQQQVQKLHSLIEYYTQFERIKPSLLGIVIIGSNLKKVPARFRGYNTQLRVLYPAIGY